MVRTIAYIMSRFPHLPETFILREMIELERHGWQVALYPLIRQRQPMIHAEARPWIPRARRLPYISPKVCIANGYAFIRKPLQYSVLWRRVVLANRTSPQILLRVLALFPKAAYAARLMRQEGITHIHAHYATYPALIAWLIHNLTGISYSITVHAHDIFVNTTMLATKLRDAAFIVAISNYNRNYLTRILGDWVKAKTHVIHCGINPADYIPHSTEPCDKKTFEIISTGSLQPYKGYVYLIQACALLRERGIPFRCRIIGGGEGRSALERLITQQRLNSLVELLGPKSQEEVARLLLTARCYVQPSIITASGKMEGIPVALMEALACNLPVVATSLSGLPELVRNGDTGYLVPPADASALAEALAAAYTDPQEATRRARSGRALVLREFDLQTNVGRLADLFSHVVLSRPSAVSTSH